MYVNTFTASQQQFESNGDLKSYCHSCHERFFLRLHFLSFGKHFTCFNHNPCQLLFALLISCVLHYKNTVQRCLPLRHILNWCPLILKTLMVNWMRLYVDLWLWFEFVVLNEMCLWLWQTSKKIQPNRPRKRAKQIKQERIREQMKRSKLGKHVPFLFELYETIKKVKICFHDCIHTHNPGVGVGAYMGTWCVILKVSQLRRGP